MEQQNARQFVILVVLDGWGIAPESSGNAITRALTPNIKRLWTMYPHTQLGASGDSVGLPRGEDGNTETGHLNLGAGRIVYQDLARINMAIADGSFLENLTLINAIKHANENNSNLHIMGLVGGGGVHSSMEHLFALIALAKKQQFTRLYLHLFTDGRDSPPTAATNYIKRIEEITKKEGLGQIASVMGRYWSMDRDRRWDRTQKAYEALVNGQAKLYKNPIEAVEDSYKAGRTDEFIEPSLMVNEEGQPIAKISDNDSVVFFNFRIDRPRQLTKAFLTKDWSTADADRGFDPYSIEYTKKHLPVNQPAPTPLFERGKALNNLYFVTMTEYSKTIVEAGAKVAFPPEQVISPLGRVIADHDLKQLRASESEKERFVTYYFNGQQEIKFSNEDHLIVSSPNVPTYDQKPDMSARELTDAVLSKLQINNNYSFVLINFANADMVGHTGNLEATIKACQVVDECIGRLSNFVLASEGTMLVTADHGNAEEMINSQTGEVDTEHSTFPVPFIAVSKKLVGRPLMLRTGILADVAPTVLSLLNISAPSTMIGRNLLEEVKF